MLLEEFSARLSQTEAVLNDLRYALSDQETRGTASAGSVRAPYVELSADGKIAHGHNGLSIEYRGSDACPYGRSATANKREFEALVIHHTGNHKTTDWFVQYQIAGDPARGGHFGYHFYIAPDGRIIQGAPLTKRTNHIKPSGHAMRKTFGRHANNSRAIGVTCAEAGKPNFQPTQQQLDALDALIPALCSALMIPTQSIFGHGEIQLDRNATEGTSAASDFRTRTFPTMGVTGFATALDGQDDMDDGPLDEDWDQLMFDGVPEAGAPPEDSDDETAAVSVWHQGEPFSDAVGAAPLTATSTRLRYTNQHATRNRECTADLEMRLVEAVEAVYGTGCTINIYSGGQDRKGHGNRRTGSIRHDDFGQGGRAADVHVFDSNGSQIRGLALARLGQFWLASGFGAVGHEMRGGGIHLDEWAIPPTGGGMFWTYAHSRNQPWGAQARRMLELGAMGIAP